MARRLTWLLATILTISDGVFAGRIDWTDAGLVQGFRGFPEIDENLRFESLQSSTPVYTDKGLVSGSRVLEPLPHDQRLDLKSCHQTLVEHTFANSYGIPFSAQYYPPDCKFNRVVANLTVTSKGVQFDRLGSIYLGDVEIWRTSTAEPSSKPGIVWTHWKDLTAYLPLWRTNHTIIFDLGNLMNRELTGTFNVTLTASFLDVDLPLPGAEVADMILPISARKSLDGKPSVWNYPQQKAITHLTIPNNTVRAVVSIGATGQSSEEFWWSNVPDRLEQVYFKQGTLPAKGSFREVRLRIDNNIAGLVWPYPVVFTGGVSPALHRPLVSPQVFDLLENEIDITPWLGVLCDGKKHKYSIEVVGANERVVNSYWVLSGKMFIWVDPDNLVTQGEAPKVLLSEPNFESQELKGTNMTWRYSQTVSRKIDIKAKLVIKEEILRHSWSQKFSMANDGVLKRDGDYQVSKSFYQGESNATKDLNVYYYNGFSYPIEITLDKTVISDPAATRFMAEIYQGYNITTTGQSVSSLGLEPFILKLDKKVSGSAVSATKKGKAVVFQARDGRETLAQSNARTSYFFAAKPLMITTGIPFDPNPLLYSQELYGAGGKHINGSTFMYATELQYPPTRKTDYNRRFLGQFAPIPNEEQGGTKIFWGKNVVNQSTSTLDSDKKESQPRLVSRTAMDTTPRLSLDDAELERIMDKALDEAREILKENLFGKPKQQPKQPKQVEQQPKQVDQQPKQVEQRPSITEEKEEVVEQQIEAPPTQPQPTTKPKPRLTQADIEALKAQLKEQILRELKEERRNRGAQSAEEKPPKENHSQVEEKPPKENHSLVEDKPKETHNMVEEDAWTAPGKNLQEILDAKFQEFDEHPKKGDDGKTTDKKQEQTLKKPAPSETEVHDEGVEYTQAEPTQEARKPKPQLQSQPLSKADSEIEQRPKPKPTPQSQSQSQSQPPNKADLEIEPATGRQQQPKPKQGPKDDESMGRSGGASQTAPLSGVDQELGSPRINPGHEDVWGSSGGGSSQTAPLENTLSKEDIDFLLKGDTFREIKALLKAKVKAQLTLPTQLEGRRV